MFFTDLHHYSWIEDEPVARRILQIWEHLCKMVKYWKGIEMNENILITSFFLAFQAYVNSELFSFFQFLPKSVSNLITETHLSVYKQT